MKPLFEIFDAENEKLLASQEIKKNLHKIDAEGASVVVQLSSGDVKGNNFRALRPGDTELVVGVYSVNDKGNLAVLTGLGKEPVAVISTIFDIVKTCVTKNKTIETIVFRLNKRALKGKEKLLQRIIQKLVKARFGSRFEIKDEFIDVSPAMSFVVAQKSNAEELGDEFIEKQEKVKDKMVVKQLAIDFDNSESNASEIELLKKYGTPTKVAEKTYSLKVPGLDVEVLVDLNPGSKTKIVAINVDENQAKQIHKSGLEQYVSVKASEPGLTDVYSTKFDEYILSTIIHYAKGGKTHTVGNYDDDYDYPPRDAKPNHEYASKQGAYDATFKANPAKNLTIKAARKIALDFIKSYADANKLKKSTLSKYRYINIIGSSSMHSNNQVLMGTTLASGTTIPEYRDEEKCSGWIGTEYSKKINSNTITTVATDIKYRLQQEGFNVTMTSQNWYRYLESDDFVIVVALDFPKKSQPFETSGNRHVDMISAYLYNKLTNKVYLLADAQSVASNGAQELAGKGAYDAVIKAKPAKPANNLTIKDAKKFALDEIKSYAYANNLRRETLFKYEYSNPIGGNSTHSNRQVLPETTLPSGTTIAEYRDNKKCSGWIHDSSQVKPSDVAELALAIKRRLKKEGLNLSITKNGRDRYLEADDFVIAIAMAVPRTSEPFSISGNIGINMICAYIYNKATDKTYLLTDDQSVSGEMTEAKSLFDIAKMILEQNRR